MISNSFNDQTSKNDTDLLYFLHINPIFDLEQEQRYEQLNQISDRFSKLSKNLQQYLSDGKKACDSLSIVISSIEEFEIIASNPSFASSFQIMKSVWASLSSHLEQITTTVIQPLKLFIKNDFDSLLNAQKENTLMTEKFFSYQDKILAGTKDKKPLKAIKHQEKVVELSKTSAISFFKFVRQMDITEASFDSVLGLAVCIIPFPFILFFKIIHFLKVIFFLFFLFFLFIYYITFII